jgi:GNAT superfamily N-acetyltransferase
VTNAKGRTAARGQTLVGSSASAKAPWQVRPGRQADVPFLRVMLYEAAFWHPERPRLPIDEALAEPHLARYISGWGRPGDTAVIAEDAAARPIGAAWYRLFSPAEPGYGFIDPAIPELAIAVVADWRGRGVGTALLATVLDAARTAGFAAVSLSVEPTNPALTLYEHHGFIRVGMAGGSWTMRVDLAPSAHDPRPFYGPEV